jgi:hypothetical protein
VRKAPARISLRLSAENESFSIPIDDADDATSPFIGGLRNFIWINPVFDSGRAVCCRTSDRRRFVLSGCIDYFDLAATNQFVAAPAKPSIVQRLPFPESVQSAQKNKAVGRIQSNRRIHFHQRTLSERARQDNRAASRKADRKNPYSKCGG